MHIYIKHVQSKICPQYKPFLIDIHSSLTIKQVKDRITQHINVPSNDQFLSFQGQTLEDEHILGSYDTIKDESTVCLVIFPNVYREKSQVFLSIGVDERESKIVDIEIFYYDTVAQVKQGIFERTSIPILKQRIILAGKQIEDDRIF